MFNFLRKRKYRDYQINPDEIFIDTLNISGMDTQQFEGIIQKPIGARLLYFLSGFLLLVTFIFIGRLGYLQLSQGNFFLEKSKNNTLRAQPLFAERGVIYDRNGVELAWNIERENKDDFTDYDKRSYIGDPGFGHILGYVKYPQMDNNKNYWQVDIIGQDGIEKKMDAVLSGENGSVLYEVDALGQVLSNNGIKRSQDGNNVTTTLDAKIQTYLYQAIKKQSEEGGFDAGAGGIMDIRTGELLAMVSYPEYDPDTLAEGVDAEKIKLFFSDTKKPFLNRFVAGLYAPGSIVKPFVALAALEEGVINENTTVMSTGRIEIPNKYNPSNKSIYKDWRSGGHGVTDVKHAIADSVNTFFYAISGGYKKQKGIGIAKIEYYLRLFDFAQKTGIDFSHESQGVIPNPEWKKKRFKDGTWRLGDTYITSIGQFGFQVSPLQVLRSVSAIANDGFLPLPVLLQSEIAEPKKISRDIKPENYQIIRDAMRQTTIKGSAKNLNLSEVDIAVKTGTAQIGKNNEYYNSWVLGFFPYKKPKYAFVIVMEKADRGGTGSASRAMRNFIEKVTENYPDFWYHLKEE